MRERELANILVDGTVDGEKRVALKNDCSLCVRKRDVRKKRGKRKRKDNYLFLMVMGGQRTGAERRPARAAADST